MHITNLIKLGFDQENTHRPWSFSLTPPDTNVPLITLRWDGFKPPDHHWAFSNPPQCIAMWPHIHVSLCTTSVRHIILLQHHLPPWYVSHRLSTAASRPKALWAFHQTPHLSSQLPASDWPCCCCKSLVLGLLREPGRSAGSYFGLLLVVVDSYTSLQPVHIFCS